jgi:hypothetical protein
MNVIKNQTPNPDTIGYNLLHPGKAFPVKTGYGFAVILFYKKEDTVVNKKNIISVLVVFLAQIITFTGCRHLAAPEEKMNRIPK